MRIFVTGGTGFIGSHFINKALAAGHDVVAIRREGSETKLRLVEQPRWEAASLAEAKRLFDDGNCRDIDVLVHFAAAGVLPHESNWFDCCQSNVVDSLALWKSAVAAGVRRIVSCGSFFEYGAAGARYERIPVSCPLEPFGPYASSKAAATILLTGMARDSGVEAAVLRPFHVYGEGEDGSRLWPSLKASAEKKFDFPMTKGEQIRDMVPVDIVADSFLAVATRRELKPGEPEVHNVGTGVPMSVLAFASYWWSRWNASGKLIPGALSYRPDEVMRCVPELSLDT